jgi:hypothetical protein
VRLRLGPGEAITAIIAVIRGRVLAWTTLTTALSLELSPAAILLVPVTADGVSRSRPIARILMCEFEECSPGVVLDFNRDIRRWGSRF